MGSGIRRGQQEMVGFVLIVVLVVVALMIVLMISLRTSDTGLSDSLEVDGMLGALFDHTTSCATEFVPKYESYKDLFKACHRGVQCKNKGVSACEYLNVSLRETLDSMMQTTTYESYQLVVVEGASPPREVLHLSNGVCTSGVSFGAQRNIAQGSANLVVRLRVC